MDSTTYQQARTQLVEHIDRLRTIREELVSRDPLLMNGLPIDVRQKMLLLDRESNRLRNPDLTIAFVGGFSAGKSSLINAFLGRYLLPESPKVTTAVPTFIRSTNGEECAELHYLNQAEIDNLGEMYRKEIAAVFGQPELASLPYASLIEQVRPRANEGRGQGLVKQFEIFHEERQKRQTEPRGRVVTASIDAAQGIIRDETEAMFLDRVTLRVARHDIPEDTVLVDLPGISVPNPRHREITFRFVRQEAHAIVFVLMATQLFTKDVCEIMELFRAGENQIADKTFWVLNRWDALNSQQQHQTIADFEANMREFAIPNGFQSFRTNALHGLLSQLGMRGESPMDLELLGHKKDYEQDLPVRYGNSHDTAFKESQIRPLQNQVLSFLNDRLRQTTLSSAVDNVKANFAEPAVHHLRRAKEADDKLITGHLKREEKEVLQKRIDVRVQERTDLIGTRLKSLRHGVAVKRRANLIEKTKELVEKLQTKIEDGPETDAYQIYQEIIGGHGLRMYPYHFEIEMEIVDNLNTSLKKEFLEIVRSQSEEVFRELTDEVQTALEKVREDINYNAEVMQPFDDIIHNELNSFCDRVTGVAMTLAAQLDELLLYKPKTFFGLTGGNEILEGLEQAARMGSENLRTPGQAIQEKDFSEKTKKIRDTLTAHYIDKVREYHERITNNIFPIVINNMRQIEERLLETLKTKYRPALELVMAQEVDEEFGLKRKETEARSRRFRNWIDGIEQGIAKMSQVLTELKMSKSAIVNLDHNGIRQPVGS